MTPLTFLGSPSCYVLKIFNANRGDVILPIPPNVAPGLRPQCNAREPHRDGTCKSSGRIARTTRLSKRRLSWNPGSAPARTACLHASSEKILCTRDWRTSTPCSHPKNTWSSGHRPAALWQLSCSNVEEALILSFQPVPVACAVNYRYNVGIAIGRSDEVEGP